MTEAGIILLLLYVDDIVITGSDSTGISSVISALGDVFDMKDLGRLSYFLGINGQHTSEGLFLSQEKYAIELERAGLGTCKICSKTPCLPHLQMVKDEVNTVCQFMRSPTDVHFTAVKCILRYIQGTIGKGLLYKSGSQVPYISGWCDANWAGDINTRRSTTGFVIFLGSCPISWQSKEQGSVSRNSTEAEYMSLANTTAEISWIRQVMCDINVKVPAPPLMRERVQRQDLQLQYVPTAEQVADIFTKGLHSSCFRNHVSNLSLVTLAEIEGGC